MLTADADGGQDCAIEQRLVDRGTPMHEKSRPVTVEVDSACVTTFRHLDAVLTPIRTTALVPVRDLERRVPEEARELVADLTPPLAEAHHRVHEAVQCGRPHGDHQEGSGGHETEPVDGVGRSGRSILARRQSHRCARDRPRDQQTRRPTAPGCGDGTERRVPRP